MSFAGPPNFVFNMGWSNLHLNIFFFPLNLTFAFNYSHSFSSWALLLFQPLNLRRLLPNEIFNGPMYLIPLSGFPSLIETGSSGHSVSRGCIRAHVWGILLAWWCFWSSILLSHPPNLSPHFSGRLSVSRHLLRYVRLRMLNEASQALSPRQSRWSKKGNRKQHFQKSTAS